MIHINIPFTENVVKLYEQTKIFWKINDYFKVDGSKKSDKISKQNAFTQSFTFW